MVSSAGIVWGKGSHDVIVIVSRNWVGDGQWDWTYNPRSFYTLPTRWMGD